MAKNNKADMSCARVKKYSASDVSKAERHNERKNETYENMNVIEERIPFNVHFKKPFAQTYMEQLKQMEADGLVSLRGLRKDATLFNEIVIDVNTMYFERNGGYEYAKQFYEEAYHFIEEKFGADNIISAVMHADEINVAATEELGKEIYHYHLHAMVLPVVEKEILWSKRCKDEKLRGTVKEVVNQISHSKKWKSDIPLTDEKGNPLLRKNGKPMYWLMKQLQPLNCQTTIYLVKLPTWEYGKENTMTSKIAWGEVSPGEWGNYITLQEKANPVFLSACAMKWNQLQNENAPLRAMLNGKLQSVSEDIYDSFILREIAEQPEQFKMAIVIGNVLGKYQLGISDVWISNRIDKMLEDGVLEIIQDAPKGETNYRRILRKRMK